MITRDVARSMNRGKELILDADFVSTEDFIYGVKENFETMWS